MSDRALAHGPLSPQIFLELGTERVAGKFGFAGFWKWRSKALLTKETDKRL
jgi:hypothetical protein